jgi:hypothetical protein
MEKAAWKYYRGLLFPFFCISQYSPDKVTQNSLPLLLFEFVLDHVGAVQQ